jgi:hypothetical protein
MEDWIDSVPNDGLIRYLGMLNQERIFPTSPKALAEVLVQRNYEFIKPRNVREGIGRILGVGILLAEGDEHKVQRKNLMPAFAYRHVKNLYPVFWGKAGEVRTFHCLFHKAIITRMRKSPASYIVFLLRKQSLISLKSSRSRLQLKNGSKSTLKASTHHLSRKPGIPENKKTAPAPPLFLTSLHGLAAQPSTSSA